ncbi:hypothetical protein C0J52_12771 [Blattella germanica]|nr:hypothetical protein C0J52_12771 [Blattella germanica]
MQIAILLDDIIMTHCRQSRGAIVVEDECCFIEYYNFAANFKVFTSIIAMPNIYKAPPDVRAYKRYSDEKPQQCLEDIATGKCSERNASVHYNIPRQTIRNKIKGVHCSTVESEAEDLIFDDSTDTPSEDDLDDELSFEEPCSSKKSRRADKVVQNETLFTLDEFVIVNYEGTLFPGIVTGITPKN